MGSPLAGTWLLFHIAGCIALLYNGKYPNANRCFLWWATLGWLITLGVSTFILTPINGSASFMWIIAAMPSLALCLRKEHLSAYCVCFMTVILVYACGLIMQEIVHMQYTTYNVDDRRSWPLMDPNNAAAVVNMALLPCVYMILFSSWRWIVPALIFSIALATTGSQTGFAACAAGIIMISTARFGARFLLSCMIIGLSIAAIIFFTHADWIVRIYDRIAMRFPIWEASYTLVWIRPWSGIGLGAFGYYYSHVRLENYTQGWHSHNDLLQFAIEMGIPAMLVFCGLIITVIFTIRPWNLISGCVILAVFLQSMMEFQFYIPAVSYPMGLALAAHMLLTKERRKVIMR